MDVKSRERRAPTGALHKTWSDRNAEAPRAYKKFEIVSRKDFSDVTFLLEVYHPLMAKAAKTGQFVNAMTHEHGERIPFSPMHCA